MATDRSKTTMLIKEVVVPEGSGDVVINVEATRGDRTYRLPYHIREANIGSVQREWLMAKVLEDVDALVEQDNKKAAVMTNLEGLVGKTIKLD